MPQGGLVLRETSNLIGATYSLDHETIGAKCISFTPGSRLTCSSTMYWKVSISSAAKYKLTLTPPITIVPFKFSGQLLDHSKTERGSEQFTSTHKVRSRLLPDVLPPHL